jgi:hypothetical protein
MEWQDTPDSSNISRFGYENGALYIEFHNGAVWKYVCDESVFEAMKAADSKGRFFAQEIKGTYQGVKA